MARALTLLAAAATALLIAGGAPAPTGPAPAGPLSGLTFVLPIYLPICIPADLCAAPAAVRPASPGSASGLSAAHAGVGLSTTTLRSRGYSLST